MSFDKESKSEKKKKKKKQNKKKKKKTGERGFSVPLLISIPSLRALQDISFAKVRVQVSSLTVFSVFQTSDQIDHTIAHDTDIKDTPDGTGVNLCKSCCFLT